MGELIVIGVVAGVLAGVSPCIIPVLPVILVAGGTAPVASASGAVPRPGRRLATRPVAVVAGLVVGFSLLILLGSEMLSLLHLPQDTLRDVGIAALVVVGVGYLVPPVALLIERPFARLGRRQPSGNAEGFALGLALVIRR